MSSSVFLLAAVLAAGQSSPSDTTLRVEVDPLESIEPVQIIGPAEFVAARVRGVLQDHTSERAWQELAGALPDLTLGPRGDDEAIYEAARLADEMSSEGSETAIDDSLSTAAAISPLVSNSIPEEGPRFAAATLGFVRPAASSLMEMLSSKTGMRFAAWIAISLLSIVIVLRVLRGAPARAPSLAPVRTRLTAARALAVEGRSIGEISRETRLAREALSVLLQANAR